MAEKSYLWSSPGGAGDGSVAYTRLDWQRIVQVLSDCGGWQGIAPGLLSLLAGSAPSANTARIASGGAVVDGKPYYSDANVDTNIPSAVGGGNTRIDRLVLRCNWTAQTVRVTRLAGVDAASPTPPAITQTSGTTYDIPLYQVLVNTAGALTLTDERSWARAGANAINDGAITAEKLANDSVDDAKVGARVPQFYRRQGGHATQWGTVGANNYTPGAVRMQAGAAQVTNADTGVAIIFPVAFSASPIVISVGVSGGTIPVQVSLSNSQVTLLLINTSGAQVGGWINWLAIGPE